MAKKQNEIVKDVESIQSRNDRVELDKAWETSWTRRLLIALLTYAIIALYLPLIGVKDAWLHALVPVTGFLLSTLTLQWVKRIWIKNKA